MADEKNLKIAGSTFDMLVKMLDERKWTYDAKKEELVIETGAQGDDLPIPLHISVDADRQVVIMYSFLPFEIPENKRLEIALAVSVINDSIVDGSFDYNFVSGRLVYRLTSSFMGSVLSKALFEYMVDCTCATVDNYNDKLEAIIKGTLDVKAFINSVLK